MGCAYNSFKLADLDKDIKSFMRKKVKDKEIFMRGGNRGNTQINSSRIEYKNRKYRNG